MINGRSLSVFHRFGGGNVQRSACVASAVHSRRRKNESLQPFRGTVTLKQANSACSDASETGAGSEGTVPSCRLRQLTTVERGIYAK